MSPQGDVTQIPVAKLRRLYDYWFSKRELPDLPACADLVFDDIAELLPHVMLAEVLDNGRHFRFMLIGSDLLVGVDPTGKLQHEELPDGIYRDHITALFRRGAAGPGALYSRSSYGYVEVQGPRTIGRLFLPLASNGTIIDMMLIGQVSDSKIAMGHSPWQTNPPSITEEIEFRLP